MSQGARKRATYEDVLQAPEHMVAELFDGQLSLLPRPAPRHARATTKLGASLDGPFDNGRGGPGGWILLDEPEWHFDGDVMVPDLAGWRRERMPSMPEEAYFTLAPDWICEVLSPSTMRIDRMKKVPRYARGGVSHVWLLDPLARSLEILRLTSSGYLLTQSFLFGTEPDLQDGEVSDREVRAEPFDAVALDLSVLWSR